MTKFRYIALNHSGERIRGVITEEDFATAKEKLAALGVRVIRIKKSFSLSIAVRHRQFGAEDLAVFCGQMAVIIDSGVALLRGIDILAQQTQLKTHKAVLEQILGSIKKGLTLSDAMRLTGVFPELLTDMIDSGEISGSLPELLFNMEEFYSREVQIRSKIKSASMYPSILLVTMVLMIIFFSVFVFSELRVLFEDIQDMPKITANLIVAMEFINGHPLLLLFSFGVVCAAGALLLRIGKVRYAFDYAILKAPGIGRLKMDIITARLTSSMAILIKSAIPLIKILNIMEALAANQYLSKRINHAKDEIIRGQSIASAFEKCEVFDPMVVQMMQVGEETGKLEELLFKLAVIYDKRTTIGINRFLSMIEPAFTLIVGLVVGFVIIAMAMPIFQMSSIYR